MNRKFRSGYETDELVRRFGGRRFSTVRVSFRTFEQQFQPTTNSHPHFELSSGSGGSLSTLFGNKGAASPAAAPKPAPTPAPAAQPAKPAAEAPSLLHAVAGIPCFR